MNVVRRRIFNTNAQSHPHLLTCKLSYTQADSIVEYHEASNKVSDVQCKVEEQSLLCGEVITIVDLSPQTHVDG